MFKRLHRASKLYVCLPFTTCPSSKSTARQTLYHLLDAIPFFIFLPIRQSWIHSLHRVRNVHKTAAGAQWPPRGPSRFLRPSTVGILNTQEYLVIQVVVIGRANVGKSTFLNAVLGRRDIAHTSKKAVSPTQLVYIYMVETGY